MKDELSMVKAKLRSLMLMAPCSLSDDALITSSGASDVKFTIPPVVMYTGCAAAIMSDKVGSSASRGFLIMS